MREGSARQDEGALTYFPPVPSLQRPRSPSGLTSHAPAHSPCPRLNSFSYPSQHAPLALTARALAPNTAPTTEPPGHSLQHTSPLTTAPPVPLLPFRRRGRCWASTSRASARRSHAPSRSGCPASYSSRPRPSCPKRRGRTSSRERARHLARAGDACTGRVARACTPGGRMKLAACFHFSLDEPPVDAEPQDLAECRGTLLGQGHLMVRRQTVI